MAGIGVKLNNIFRKKSIVAYLAGLIYSSLSTVTPVFVVILDILLMGHLLGFNNVGFVEREMFSCTVLYIFVFALLTTAPFNSVLSRYMSDVIYKERYEDILPCYYIGLFMNILFSSLLGIPFCLRAHFVGKMDVFYIFTGYCGYIALVLVFYSMIYLSITKDYQRTSLFFLIGMAWSILLALALRYVLGWKVRNSMLFALTTGFLVIAFLEFALVKRYFVSNSNQYRPVLQYFRKYWQLVVANFFYILGLYIHNFVFWASEQKMVVMRTFVCCQAYDIASCLAMFTNLSATVIFIAGVEMHFHDKYKDYSEAVIGGKGADIDSTKKEMFRQLSAELMNLVRIQFVITTVVYLLATVFLPKIGISNLAMRIYPCLTVGYFIIFVMYSGMIYLYYFNDLTGAVMTALVFCFVTFAGSILAAQLSELWYGIGVVAGAFAGWTAGYFRLRFIEKHLDEHIFCSGSLLEAGKGVQPSAKVYEKQEEGE